MLEFRYDTQLLIDRRDKDLDEDETKVLIKCLRNISSFLDS